MHLLSAPVPVPWSLLLRAVVVTLGYMAFAPHAPVLATFGLHPLNLAFAAGVLSVLLYSGSDMIAKMDLRREEALKITLPLWALMLIGIIVQPTSWLVWCVPAMIACNGALLWLFLRFDPDCISRLGWTHENWGAGRDNAVYWNILRNFALAVALVGVARTGTPSDWIAGVALIPLMLHYLYWWTIFATHPDEDEIV